MARFANIFEMWLRGPLSSVFDCRLHVTRGGRFDDTRVRAFLKKVDLFGCSQPQLTIGKCRSLGEVGPVETEPFRSLEYQGEYTE